MNRIDQTFKRLRAGGDKALVGFVTAGDPDPQRSRDLVAAMCRSGLDLLELGIPFSDPTADGPVIQRASQRALSHGVGVREVLAETEAVRSHSDIPIVLFGYFNPILAYGLEDFHRDALAAGADGVLVVDLPPEESAEVEGCWPVDGLAVIRLVAPTTPAQRMAKIAAMARGFLYLVSKTGVTGSEGLEISGIRRQCADLQRVTPLPLCVGFGISTERQVAQVAAVADGVVIGSAFERLIEANLENPELTNLMADRTRRLKAATQG